MRRRLKWMLIGQLVLLLFVYANLALWAGEYIDSICVEGRFSAKQAQIHNTQEWGKCPSYRMRANGKCEAEERDRVVKHYCSDPMRALTWRNNPTWKRIRHTFQELIFGSRV